MPWTNNDIKELFDHLRELEKSLTMLQLDASLSRGLEDAKAGRISPIEEDVIVKSKPGRPRGSKPRTDKP